MQWKFTHAAEAAAKIAVQNALFGRRKRLSALVMPWCTYTEPEIAHVGLYEAEAHDRRLSVDTFKIDFKDLDRAITNGDVKGFVKIQTKKGTDRIIGATIVASQAGEMINEITLAIHAGIGLKKIAWVIHPYPTLSESIKKAADTYYERRLTPFLKTVFSKWFAWLR